ncbi:hypothetical protein QYE76_049548 [Lolium multiflorum]|uniref:Reverse transcriptase Ty1/copia-type domain-containing protein n=1 Tax=Lolium multiflorum TaxID=4521 RepID=A0AAD8WGF7_LOLMU|nr:hypothetical protein QYE76_049548 [Lolium multiflorum]
MWSVLLSSIRPARRHASHLVLGNNNLIGSRGYASNYSGDRHAEVKRHLYVVLDDHEDGFGVHKLDLRDSDDDEMGRGAARRLPEPPTLLVTIPTLGKRAQFSAVGTSIVAIGPTIMSPLLDGSWIPDDIGGVLIYDTKTAALTVVPHLPARLMRGYKAAMTVGNNLYMLGTEPPCCHWDGGGSLHLRRDLTYGSRAAVFRFRSSSPSQLVAAMMASGTSADSTASTSASSAGLSVPPAASVAGSLALSAGPGAVPPGALPPGTVPPGAIPPGAALPVASSIGAVLPLPSGTDVNPSASTTMASIRSDASRYSDSLAASMQHMAGLGTYPGYHNYPQMAGLGTYPLALGFPRPPLLPPAGAPSLPYTGTMPYSTPPGFPPQPQQPPSYGAGPFNNHAFPSIVTIAPAITIKLTSDNYMFWRAQVGPLLRSHMLMGYVDGSFVCPDPHVVVSHAGGLHQQPNPAHQHWIQQDQAILSGFVSSMTEGVLGMIMFAGTSREAWETLSGAFASTSIARASALRQEMADLKKDNKTINVYFHQMKALSDSLTSIGMPLRDDEFISSLLAGLGEEYDALFEVVNARTTPMQIRDLFSQLQATEQRKLAQRRTHGGAAHYPAAHAAASTPAGPVAAWTARGSPRPSAPPPKTAPPPAAPKPTAGRGSVVCQLCGVPRHTASRCYKRFNRDFLGIGNDGRDTEKQLSMAMTASHGSSSGAPQVADPAWYADSGATHHITHELDKLTSREPYHGTDQVHTANGSGTGRGGRLEILIPHAPPRDVDKTAPVMHGLQPMHGSPSGCVQPCNAAAPACNASGSASSCMPACEDTHRTESGLDAAAPCMSPAGSLDAMEKPDAPHATRTIAVPGMSSDGSLDAACTPARTPASRASNVSADDGLLSPAAPTPVSPVSRTATPLASSPATATSSPEIAPPVSSAAPVPPPTGPVTRLRRGIQQPKKRTDGTVAWNCILQAYSASKHTQEPRDYKEALRIPHWRDAMEAEFSALQDTGTWRLVPPIPGVNLIDSRWIFKVKLHADGSIERYKARLVAKGYKQRYGLDYDETFSPVVKPATIRLLLGMALSHHWYLRQLDIQNAFLHGYLDEEVYMRQPPGFVDSSRPDHYCRLVKSLYGLKQAPRAWHARLSSVLGSLGFSPSVADTSLFILRRPDVTIFLLIYVDDIIVLSSLEGAIPRLIGKLRSEFSVKDLGALHYFLGIEVSSPSAGHLLLQQRKYALELLARAGMLKCAPVTTPMASSERLCSSDGDALSPEEATQYRSIVGGLQYLTVTRPDLSFVVNKVCQFLHEPRTPHWSAVKRILRYLSLFGSNPY